MINSPLATSGKPQPDFCLKTAEKQMRLGRMLARWGLHKQDSRPLPLCVTTRSDTRPYSTLGAGFPDPPVNEIEHARLPASAQN